MIHAFITVFIEVVNLGSMAWPSARRGFLFDELWGLCWRRWSGAGWNSEGIVLSVLAWFNHLNLGYYIVN